MTNDKLERQTHQQCIPASIYICLLQTALAKPTMPGCEFTNIIQRHVRICRQHNKARLSQLCRDETNTALSHAVHSRHLLGLQNKKKQVRQWGLTYIHTCRSYVHTPLDIPWTAHL